MCCFATYVDRNQVLWYIMTMLALEWNECQKQKEDPL